MGFATSLFPLATYGFRIGAVQIPGTPDIESLIHQEHAPLLIDPSLQARSLGILRGTPSAPPMMVSHSLTGESQRFTNLLLPTNEHPSGVEKLLGASRTATGAWGLRTYQQRMMEGLKADIRSQAAPWLGLSSPMQTGKSRLTGPIIRLLRQELGDDIRILILTSGRVITGQMMEDLLGDFPEQEIGRYDGLVKAPAKITVASTLALVLGLDQFPPGPKTVVILDEAYTTQSPSVGKILAHFGLSKREPKEKGGRVVPMAGNGFVVGFSGTGAGLDGYRISGSLSLLEAMELGWIRHMRSERLPVQIESQRMVATGGEKMIWWKATSKNAEFLADLFDEKIHPSSRKSLLFVPTIRHGRLLRKSLEKKYGKGFVRFVHSGPDRDETLNAAELRLWQERGGALISVRMISRGFRATGADAVFHTYQTDSLELFGQRTGRAWGVSEGEPFPDLYVLETTWGPPGHFANLPRLAGLVDVPKGVFETRSLQGSFKALKRKAEQRGRRAERIRQGKLSPLFSRIPLNHEWQKIFEDILKKNGGVAGVVKKTGITPETVAAFELGVIPTRLVQMERLMNFLGGKKASEELWVRLWKTAVEEIGMMHEETDEDLRQALINWHDFAASSLEEEVLSRFFPKRVGTYPVFERLFHKTREVVPANIHDEELREIIDDVVKEYVSEEEQTPFWLHPDANGHLLLQERRNVAIFKRYVLDDEDPAFLKAGQNDNALSREAVRQIIEKSLLRLEKWIYLRACKKFPRPPDGVPLTTAHQLFFVEISELPFGVRAKQALEHKEIKFLGELTRMNRPQILKIRNLSHRSFREIRHVLSALGVSLASDDRDDYKGSWLVPKKGEPLTPKYELFYAKVSQFPFETKIQTILKENRIHYLYELVRKTKTELLALQNMGPKCLKEIVNILRAKGLSLGMPVS